MGIFSGGSVGSFTPGPYAYFGTFSAVSLATGSRFTWTPFPGASYPNNVANAALLFDLTVPTLPVVVRSGVYAISVEAICSDVHAGKVMAAYIFFDADGPDDGPGTYGIPLDSGFSIASATGVRALTAGMKVEAILAHNIGAAADFDIWMQAQRIA